MDKEGTDTDSGGVELQTYTYAEAAGMMHCSVGSVRRLVKQGVIKGFSFTGNPRIVTHLLAKSVEGFIANAGRLPAHSTDHERTQGRK